VGGSGVYALVVVGVVVPVAEVIDNCHSFPEPKETPLFFRVFPMFVPSLSW
jgi:hypothetical protein